MSRDQFARHRQRRLAGSTDLLCSYWRIGYCESDVWSILALRTIFSGYNVEPSIAVDVCDSGRFGRAQIERVLFERNSGGRVAIAAIPRDQQTKARIAHSQRWPRTLIASALRRRPKDVLDGLQISHAVDGIGFEITAFSPLIPGIQVKDPL